MTTVTELLSNMIRFQRSRNMPDSIVIGPITGLHLEQEINGIESVLCCRNRPEFCRSQGHRHIWRDHDGVIMFDGARLLRSLSEGIYPDRPAVP